MISTRSRATNLIPIVVVIMLGMFVKVLLIPSPPKSSTTEKPLTRAQVEEQDRKRIIGGVIGGAAFVGFIAYAFVKWFRETDQVLQPVEHGDKPWAGL
jgi:hypothetical protein